MELPEECTAPQVCAVLGIHRSTFDQWTRNNPNVPTGRDYRGRVTVSQIDLHDWLSETGRIAAKNRYRAS
jgi:hypothetical protein